MREILFKAKRKDNGEWVEGYYVYDNVKNKAFICTTRLLYGWLQKVMWIEVDSNTICQFTGMTDKNGVRIWENDVAWIVYDGKEHIYQIVWDNSELDFKATNGKENYGTNFEYLLCCEEIEVIGNIFDNKELLQGSVK